MLLYLYLLLLMCQTLMWLCLHYQLKSKYQRLQSQSHSWMLVSRHWLSENQRLRQELEKEKAKSQQFEYLYSLQKETVEVLESEWE